MSCEVRVTKPAQAPTKTKKQSGSGGNIDKHQQKSPGTMGPLLGSWWKFCFSPHCVGFLFFGCHTRPPSPPAPPPLPPRSPAALFPHTYTNTNTHTHKTLTNTLTGPHTNRSHNSLITHTTSTLRGRRQTYGTGLALVAPWGPGCGRCRRGFLAWQAWHLATWTCALRGRRGTW